MQTRKINISPNHIVNTIATFKGSFILDATKPIHAIAVLDGEQIKPDGNIFEIKKYEGFKVLIVNIEEYYNKDDYEKWIELIKNYLKQ